MLKKISNASQFLATLMIIVNLVVVMYGVIMRYLIGGAPIWTDEMARYAMIAAAFFAAGHVWELGGHMRVSLAERFLPHACVKALVFYQWIIALCIACCGVWLTAKYALSVSMFFSQGLGISRSIPLMVMPIGFSLLALVILIRGPRPIPQMLGE